MAFHAELILDGQKFKVLQCDFEFHQNIDHSHSKPSAKPEGGLLQITIEAQQGDSIILSWMQSNTMMKSGIVTFFKEDQKVPLKVINFTKAYCVSYREMFDHNDEDNLKINFVVTCQTISINGLTHKNTW